MTTIVIADDHNIVRKAVRTLLEATAGFAVVGEAADGVEAAELTARLKPDVLVCDLMMPGLSGIEVTRKIAVASPGTRIVIFSMYRSQEYVKEALAAGAHAYVLKGADSSDLERAIVETLSGRQFFSAPLSEWIIPDYAQKAGGAARDPYESLTARQKEILRLTAQGLSSPEIATCLGCSPRTVESHRSDMMRKLGVDTRTALIRYGVLHEAERPDK